MGCSLTESVQKSLLGILISLSTFQCLGLFLAFFAKRMDKTEKSSKMLGNLLVDIVKNYFGLSKRHPIVTIDVMQLNILTLESQSGYLFWTIFYNPDHCDLLSNNPFIVDGNCLILSLLVKLMLESHVEISPDWLSYLLRRELIRNDGTLFRMFFFSFHQP